MSSSMHKTTHALQEAGLLIWHGAPAGSACKTRLEQ